MKNPLLLGLLALFLTLPSVVFAQRVANQFNAGQFLDDLKSGSEEALNDRTSKYEQLEKAIDNPKEMKLGCVFKDANGSRDFRISITNIIEPKEDYGTSLMWRATATIEGSLPPKLAVADEVGYGGSPEDIYIWFESSDIALHKVAGGLASEHQGGLIKCEVLAGGGYLY